MSDATKRDAVVEEFCPQRYRESPWQTIRKLAAEDVADEIVRLRDENAALRAAVERVLALHEIFGDWCDRCNCVAPCATIAALEGTP